MPRLAPVALELAVVATVLVLGGIFPALWAARDGTGGLVVAAIPAVGPAGDHEREPLARTVGRAVLDGLVGVAIAAMTVLIDLGAIGIALVLGLGGYRLWQLAQVRRWERAHARVLLREPRITSGWLAPERLLWVEPPAIDTSLELREP